MHSWDHLKIIFFMKIFINQTTLKFFLQFWTMWNISNYHNYNSTNRYKENCIIIFFLWKFLWIKLLLNSFYNFGPCEKFQTTTIVNWAINTKKIVRFIEFFVNQITLKFYLQFWTMWMVSNYYNYDFGSKYEGSGIATRTRPH